MLTRKTWDIFCTVVDNFGDIGVTWRLARQLANEYQQNVRLWVDDLASFSHICPTINPQRRQQQCQHVDIRLWDEPFKPDPHPADIVIEAFACTLPATQITQMQTSATKPLWINLEYLSAESWIDDCHGLPSQQQGMVKYFFFPGFSAKSGGLICERDLSLQRHAWQQAPEHRQRWFTEQGLIPPPTEALWVSIFTYESPALPALLEHWQTSPQPMVCLLPMGRAIHSLPALLDPTTVTPRMIKQRGSLTIYILPMTDQSTYDRLLWSCDVNLVRGEDSFLRAQWAARPFLWHIYPQDDAAHIDKLDAFLQRYSDALSPDCQQALKQLFHAYDAGNGAEAITAWNALVPYWPEWRKHAAVWPEQVLAGGDLASRLVIFCENRLK